MKTLIVLFFAMATTHALAAGIPKICYSKAETEVANSLDKKIYDPDGFDAYECEISSNGAVILCMVSASKGDGAAMDTYRVILSKSCNHSFRVDLIGEE